MTLSRTVEAWRTLDAKAVNCLSHEQSVKTLIDAKHDILALARALRLCADRVDDTTSMGRDARAVAFALLPAPEVSL